MLFFSQLHLGHFFPLYITWVKIGRK